MGQHFSSVWYATSGKMKSIANLCLFSDRGFIEITGDGVDYHSKKKFIAMQKIERVSIARQRFPWASVMIPFVGGVILLSGMYSGSAVDWFRSPLGAQFVAFYLLVILINRRVKWVLVEYQNDTGEAQRAYFSNGSFSGWGGILGGSMRLYNALEEHLQNRAPNKSLNTDAASGGAG